MGWSQSGRHQLLRPDPVRAATTGPGPMSAFIQVISRVLQSEDRNSFNSWAVQPIVAERIARKYWPHRDLAANRHVNISTFERCHEHHPTTTLAPFRARRITRRRRHVDTESATPRSRACDRRVAPRASGGRHCAARNVVDVTGQAERSAYRVLAADRATPNFFGGPETKLTL